LLTQKEQDKLNFLVKDELNEVNNKYTKFWIGFKKLILNPYLAYFLILYDIHKISLDIIFVDLEI